MVYHTFILLIAIPLLPGLGFVLEPVETPGPIKYMDLVECLNAGPFVNADTMLQSISLNDRIS